MLQGLMEFDTRSADPAGCISGTPVLLCITAVEPMLWHLCAGCRQPWSMQDVQHALGLAQSKTHPSPRHVAAARAAIFECAFGVHHNCNDTRCVRVTCLYNTGAYLVADCSSGPAYTIPGRPAANGQEAAAAVPGPGAYDPAELHKGPAYSLAGRPAGIGQAGGGPGDDGPGPGAYDVAVAESAGPAWTMGAKVLASADTGEDSNTEMVCHTSSTWCCT